MRALPCEQLVDKYVAWLRERISVETINGFCEITTPFLDRHNDHLQIYVKPLEEGRLLLTDDGYIVRDLRMSGVEMTTQRRQQLLQSVLNGFGVHREGDALEVEATQSEFPQKKHSLIQAMIAVNDLFVMSEPHIAQLFHEDVERFLGLHSVRFTPDVKLTGKSGFDHRFDFVVPRSARKPDRAIRAINNPNRVQATNVIFAWTDTREVRAADFVVIAVLNDSERAVPEEVLKAFGRYQVPTIKWSEREEHVEELAA